MSTEDGPKLSNKDLKYIQKYADHHGLNIRYIGNWDEPEEEDPTECVSREIDAYRKRAESQDNSDQG